MWAVYSPNKRGTSEGEILVSLGERQRPRRVSVEPKDQVVLFERTMDDVQFWASGVVASVRGEDVEKIVDGETVPATRYFASIDEIEHFSEPRLLSEFRYSLERVRRFDKPGIHFRGSYSRLTPKDVEAVQEGLIHWSRTSAGMMAASIAATDQVEIVEKWLRLRGGGRTYSELAFLILEHIESRHLAFSVLVAAACKEADELPEFGELIVEGLGTEGLPKTMALGDLRSDAEGFADEWISEENPFRSMLGKDAPSIFDAKVTIEDIQRLLLFR